MKHKLTKHIIASLGIGFLSIVGADIAMQETELHNAASLTAGSCTSAADCNYGYYCVLGTSTGGTTSSSGVCTVRSRKLKDVIAAPSKTTRSTKNWEDALPEEGDQISERRLSRINRLGNSTYTGIGSKSVKGSVRKTVKADDKTISRKSWNRRLDARIREQAEAKEKRETVLKSERTIVRKSWSRRYSPKYKTYTGTGAKYTETRFESRVDEREIAREAYRKRVRLRMQQLINGTQDEDASEVTSQTK